MNMNAQAGSLQEPANSPAENNKASVLGNLQKTNEITECKTAGAENMSINQMIPVSRFNPYQNFTGASFSAVSSHEREHVSREQAKALRNDRKVVSQSVQIYIDTCPECGRAYSSGGKTTTVTRGESQKPDYFFDKMNKFFDGQFGEKIDTYI